MSIRTTRQRQIQILVRSNRGRAARPQLEASIREALSLVESISFVPLPDTDWLLQSFRDGYQNATKVGPCRFTRSFSPREAAAVWELTSRLAARANTETAYLLTRQSEECGAIEVDLPTLLVNAEAVLRLDGDSVSAISLDTTQGLLIDYNADDPEETYIVTIWGDRWCRLALDD